MNNQIEQLIKNLHEADTSEQRQTLESLAQIGTEAVEPLIALLRENEDPTLRRGAAFALGQLSDLNITPALIAALEQDSDIEVRLYAARALVVQGDARAIEPLVAALEDNDPSLREEAARSLGELADLLDSPRAVEPLAQLLDDSDWGTRQSAAEMLLRLQMEHIEQAESLLLADLQNVDNEIQLGAAWSLVELGDDRALEPLVSLLSHPDSRLSANAARGLGRLGDQRAVIPLTAALSHAKEALREAVQAALDRLNRLA